MMIMTMTIETILRIVRVGVQKIQLLGSSAQTCCSNLAVECWDPAIEEVPAINHNVQKTASSKISKDSGKTMQNLGMAQKPLSLSLNFQRMDPPTAIIGMGQYQWDHLRRMNIRTGGGSSVSPLELPCGVSHSQTQPNYHELQYHKFSYGYGSIPIDTFLGVNIHLPAILMFTRGTRVLTHCHIVDSKYHSIIFYPGTRVPQREKTPQDAERAGLPKLNTECA